MPINKWMFDENVVYKSENYSAFKKKVILSPMITCMKLEHCAKWNEPVKEDKYCLILLILGI